MAGRPALSPLRGEGEEKEAQEAFSLIEVMVAVGLLAVIIVGLLAMFYQTQRAFRSGLAQVDILEAGRATMELISRDLQEAAAPVDTITTNLQITPLAGYTPVQAILPGNGQLNNSISDLWFLRRVNDDWIGEAYRVSNSVPDGVGTMYRLLMTSNKTEVADLDLAVFSESLRSVGFGFGKYHTNFMRVADGILHFRVLPYDSHGVAIKNDNDAGIINPQGTDSYWFWSNALPAYVDIELAVLEPKALEQYRARPAAAKEAYLQRQAGRMHFFKQRVPLRNAPRYLSTTNSP